MSVMASPLGRGPVDEEEEGRGHADEEVGLGPTPVGAPRRSRAQTGQAPVTPARVGDGPTRSRLPEWSRATDRWWRRCRPGPPPTRSTTTTTMRLARPKRNVDNRRLRRVGLWVRRVDGAVGLAEVGLEGGQAGHGFVAQRTGDRGVLPHLLAVVGRWENARRRWPVGDRIRAPAATDPVDGLVELPGSGLRPAATASGPWDWWRSGCHSNRQPVIGGLGLFTARPGRRPSTT